MEMFREILVFLLAFIALVPVPVAVSYRYDVAYADYNLNENQYAIDALDYW